MTVFVIYILIALSLCESWPSPVMPFITHTTKKITSIKGSYGCPRWFDAVYNSDLEYIKKHSKNINKVTVLQVK